MLKEQFISPELSIPVLNDQYFCSRRDPVREASNWANMFAKEINSHNKIVILGLGAGFHLHFIPRGKEVFYIELVAELVERFQRICPDARAKQVSSINDLKDACILKFQPAMGSNAGLYQAVMRTQELNIKIIAEFLGQQPHLEEQKTWLSLRELVR